MIPHLRIKYDEKPWGVLPEKLGGGVRHPSWNPYPVSEKNLWFSLPYFRPHQKIGTLFQTWSPGARSVTRERDKLTSSLSFFFVRQAKRPTHANDHARDWRREKHASRGFAAQRSRACALPLLNLKKREAARGLISLQTELRRVVNNP